MTVWEDPRVATQRVIRTAVNARVPGGVIRVSDADVLSLVWSRVMELRTLRAVPTEAVCAAVYTGARGAIDGEGTEEEPRELRKRLQGFDA
jgi:hypothetical protein